MKKSLKDASLASLGLFSETSLYPRASAGCPTQVSTYVDGYSILHRNNQIGHEFGALKESLRFVVLEEFAVMLVIIFDAVVYVGNLGNVELSAFLAKVFPQFVPSTEHQIQALLRQVNISRTLTEYSGPTQRRNDNNNSNVNDSDDNINDTNNDINNNINDNNDNNNNNNKDNVIDSNANNNYNNDNNN